MNDRRSPTFSIITPVLNRAPMIRCAIESVLAQGLACEHWIIDGGSCDGTLNIVKEYQHLRLISGADRNMYDAVNKGLRAATGDLVILLNSDDLLMPNALRAVAAAYARDPEADGFCGSALIVDAHCPDAVIAAYTDGTVKTPSLSYIVSGPTIQNARILRRDIYARIGGFDDRFRIAADQEFLLRARLAGIVLRPVEAFVYCYRAHGASLTLGSQAGQHESLVEAELIARTKIAEERSFRRRLGYRAWHGWACGYLVARLAEKGELRRARQTLARGFAENPLWLLWFTRILAYKVVRKLFGPRKPADRDSVMTAAAAAATLVRLQAADHRFGPRPA